LKTGRGWHHRTLSARRSGRSACTPFAQSRASGCRYRRDCFHPPAASLPAIALATEDSSRSARVDSAASARIRSDSAPGGAGSTPDTSGRTHQRQSETGLIGRSRLLVLTRNCRAALKPTTSASRGQGGAASSEWRVNCACDESSCRDPLVNRAISPLLGPGSRCTTCVRRGGQRVVGYLAHDAVEWGRPRETTPSLLSSRRARVGRGRARSPTY
jgi:hypothetical protein